MSVYRVTLAEWTKLRSVRSNGWLLVTVIVVVVGLAVVVAVTESLQPDDTVLGGSLTAGGTLALLVSAAVGALAMAGEYGTGQVATTFAASPRRCPVLAAKAVVVAGTLGSTGLVAATAGAVVGRRLLDGAGYASGDPIPAVFGIAALLALTGVVGLAVGTVVRHPAGAVGTGMGLVLAPILLGPLLGDLQRWIVGTAPSGVLQKLAQSSDAIPDAVGSLGAWQSLAVLSVWAGLALAVAAIVVERRDA